MIQRRSGKTLPNGEKLTDYANLYFQPRNPMLYRVLHELGKGHFFEGTKHVILLEIKKDVLTASDNVYLSTHNAAVSQAEFLSVEKGIKKIDKIVIKDDIWWDDLPEGKSKVMAEVLVKDRITPDQIMSIYTASDALVQEIRKKVSHYQNVNVIKDRVKFFLPNETYDMNDRIKLIKGDMFFSTAQTLTISVNTVGIMGKGLASRAKYQFPDVFVQYQDLCRSKKLKMGKPYLIKREKSIDDVLAYAPSTLSNKNSYKWFLMFPTKNHWRENSDFNEIERGMQWLLKNYEKEGITSLALPALGCGLGNLEWHSVIPMMCSYLKQMKISSFIYLPMETELKPKHLKPDFVLNSYEPSKK